LSEPPGLLLLSQVEALIHEKTPPIVNLKKATGKSRPAGHITTQAR
jgi:hypothetical protein